MIQSFVYYLLDPLINKYSRVWGSVNFVNAFSEFYKFCGLILTFKEDLTKLYFDCDFISGTGSRNRTFQHEKKSIHGTQLENVVKESSKRMMNMEKNQFGVFPGTFLILLEQRFCRTTVVCGNLVFIYFRGFKNKVK